jgi:hypothetical protein
LSRLCACGSTSPPVPTLWARELLNGAYCPAAAPTFQVASAIPTPARTVRGASPVTARTACDTAPLTADPAEAGSAGLASRQASSTRAIDRRGPRVVEDAERGLMASCFDADGPAPCRLAPEVQRARS